MIGATAATAAQLRELWASLRPGETRELTAPVITASGETKVADWRVSRRGDKTYLYLLRLFDDRRGTALVIRAATPDTNSSEEAQ